MYDGRGTPNLSPDRSERNTHQREINNSSRRSDHSRASSLARAGASTIKKEEYPAQTSVKRSPLELRKASVDSFTLENFERNIKDPLRSRMFDVNVAVSQIEKTPAYKQRMPNHDGRSQPVLAEPNPVEISTKNLLMTRGMSKDATKPPKLKTMFNNLNLTSKHSLRKSGSVSSQRDEAKMSGFDRVADSYSVGLSHMQDIVNRIKTTRAKSLAPTMVPSAAPSESCSAGSYGEVYNSKHDPKGSSLANAGLNSVFLHSKSRPESASSRKVSSDTGKR